MRLLVALVVFFSLATPVVSAGATGITVGTLLEYCREAEDVYQSLSTNGETEPPKGAMLGTGHCFGQISAFRDTLALSLKLHREAGFKKDWKTVIRMCTPERRVSNVELARIFTLWASKHKERHRDPSVLGLLDALQRAYPCVDSSR